MATTTRSLKDDTANKTLAIDAPDAGIGAQLAPWGAMSCLVVAAMAVRIAEAAVGHDAAVAHGVAAVAFTVAVVTACATRTRLTSRRLRRRFLAAVYLGATWLSMVASSGIHLNSIALLTIVGSGLSMLYWREHRIPDGGMVTVDDGDLYADRWEKYLGAPGKQFAGSKLTELQIIKAGYRYVLDLVPGSQTVAEVRDKPQKLRGGLRLMPGQDVIVEEHPTRPAPTAILTIVTRPQIAKPQKWPGPAAAFDAETGSVNLGPFVDGEGIAQIGIYKRDGMFGGYLQGEPGSGKSRMIESIAMALAASKSHPTVIWYGDGQNGSSSPLLVKHADWAGTSNESIYAMLSAAVRVMHINGIENRVNGDTGFAPTVDRPGLLNILDECHKIFDATQNPLFAAACRELALTIAREGRKNGVALIMASQSPTLDAFGGAGNGADTLRACLLAGFGLILRSQTKNAKYVFGVDINPSDFPEIPGYAYLSRPDIGARSAPFRGFWVTDDMESSWPKKIRWRSLPGRQGNYAGADYARRREVAAEQAMHDALLLQMADAGMLDEFEAMQAAMDKRAGFPPQGTVVHYGDFCPPVRQVPRFWIPEVRTPSGLLPGQQKVLDAIRAGHTRPKAIREATFYSESQVFNLIKELSALGLIAKADYGEYRAAA